jgi:hypothetical protein
MRRPFFLMIEVMQACPVMDWTGRQVMQTPEDVAQILRLKAAGPIRSGLPDAPGNGFPRAHKPGLMAIPYSADVAPGVKRRASIDLHSS